MVVSVIGAGISGLVAAFEALQRDCKVVIFEPGPVGGMVQSRTAEGFTLEDGPNVVLERPELSRIIDLLGLRDKVLYPSVEPYQQYVWWKGRPHLVPKSPLQLLKSEIFPTSLKCALPFRLFKRGLLKGESDDETVLLFFSRLLGEPTAYALLDPVLKGIYGGNITELSARSLFPKLWEASQGGASIVDYLRSRKGAATPKVLTFKGGLQTLTNALWDRIRGSVTLIPEGVVGITPQGAGGFHITTTQGGSFHSDRVVLTPAGKRLASLIEPLSSEPAERVRAVKYASLSMCHVGVRDDAVKMRRAFGVLFPGGMKDHLLGVMFKSIIFPDTAPAGEQLLSVVFGGAQAGEFTPSESELEAWTRNNLSEHFGVHADSDRLRWLGARVWDRAIPQLMVGHHKVVSSLDTFEAQFKGLAVCGVDRGGVGVADRIGAGVGAIERLLGKGEI